MTVVPKLLTIPWMKILPTETSLLQCAGMADASDSQQDGAGEQRRLFFAGQLPDPAPEP